MFLFTLLSCINSKKLGYQSEPDIEATLLKMFVLKEA